MKPSTAEGQPDDTAQQSLAPANDQKRSEMLERIRGRLYELMTAVDEGQQGAADLAKQELLRPATDSGSLAEVSKVAENCIIAAMTGENQGARWLMGEHLRRIKDSLNEETATPLEQLLVARIAVCWLQVEYADSLYAQNAGNLTPEGDERYQRRQDRAHRRLMSAIRTLATVRRLALPVLQVNVGDKQVNVARR